MNGISENRKRQTKTNLNSNQPSTLRTAHICTTVLCCITVFVDTC